MKAYQFKSEEDIDYITYELSDFLIDYYVMDNVLTLEVGNSIYDYEKNTYIIEYEYTVNVRVNDWIVFDNNKIFVVSDKNYAQFKIQHSK